MAARQLARLRCANEVSKDAVPEEASSDNSYADEPAKAFNPFDLLAEGSDTQQHDEDEAEADNLDGAGTVVPKQHTQVLSKCAVKQKRRKKSKKSQQTDHAAPQDVDEDEVQQALRELNISIAADSAQCSTPQDSRRQHHCGDWGSGQLPAALAVDPKRLHPQEELKAKYGNRVMQEEQSQLVLPVEGAPRRYRRLAARGALPTNQMPRSLLVTPKHHWPSFDGGLGMEVLGHNLFSYTYGSHYKTAEIEWKQVERSHSPEALQHFLRVYPYHLGALMAMFDLYSAYGQTDFAQDAVERALYAMELGSHYTFKPASGLTRLDITLDINRPAFHALFRHMQSLSRRGLHATALEVCKLLINLDPSDPMRALFYIDYLAVRSRQYTVLEALASYRKDEVLYPSLAFNLALGRYYTQQGEADGDDLSTTSTRKLREGGNMPAASKQDSADATAAASKQPSADETLLQAVLMYPVAVQRMMHKLRKDKGVGKDHFWDSVLHHEIFQDATDNNSASLSHLVNIWIERNHLLWKSAPVLEWLRDVCNRATRSGAVALGLGLQEWQSAVSVWYPASSANEFSGAIENYSDHTAVLPLDPGINGDHQQLLHELEGMIQDFEGVLAQQGAAHPMLRAEDLQGANPLLAFLQTLLPWVNVEPQGFQPDDANREAAPQEDERHRN